jgi:hypothetical protein
MYLWRREASAAGILHRLNHISDQAADLGCAGVGDRFGAAQ